MSIDWITRRRFLRGLGGVVVALPFLPSVMRGAQAAGYVAPKRFIHIFTSNGQRPGNWYPRGTLPWTQTAANVRETPLTGLGDISYVLSSKFAPVKSKLLLLRGLAYIDTNGGNSHLPWFPLSGRLTAGTAVRSGVTIDQVMANSAKVYPSGVPGLRSAHMLVTTAYQGLGGGSVSVSESGGQFTDVGATSVVSQSFRSLFQGFDPNPPPPDPVAARRKTARLTLMDRVRDEYQQLRSSSKLGSEDQQRLDAHLTHLQDLQARIANTGPGPVAGACTVPGTPNDLANDVESNLPALTTANIDLLVAAIKCDRTRVATLMLCPGTDLRQSSYLGTTPGEHHSISHNIYAPAGMTLAQYMDDPTLDYRKIGNINRWYGDQVADLLTKLDVVEDPNTGATFLDNSIVYWGNEDGVLDNDSHHHNDMPVLLAGRAGGVLQTGRYVDYSHCSLDGSTGTRLAYDYQGSPFYPGPFVGRPYNALLVTLLQAMGLAPADYEKPGQPGFGDYSGNYNNQFSIAEGQQPLPYLGI